ncbi:protein LURP-one-related 11-like isoform X2 [Mangifera indica]|uniref:protein LURP-one-related 11-like isoform X2 n=1 Tax=Mangifera indica TaxID=29780 RepID=UPI001CFB6D9D|nr:protein LURP-one-related 11-like isoform X2 [Mangifera indica]
MVNECKEASKVYPGQGPLAPSASSSSSSVPCYFTSKQETFTVWMKSLVLNGKGCTVFDSEGHIRYRVDNYNSNSSNEVYLMDFDGRVLFTIIKKKYRLLGLSWEGYRSCDNKEIEMKKPGFQVRKALKILRRRECKAVLGLDNDEPYEYKIKNNWTDKMSVGWKIVDMLGEVVAEVKKKETKSGVALGDDVFTVVVKPCVDHSIIMGLLVVYSLIM